MTNDITNEKMGKQEVVKTSINEAVEMAMSTAEAEASSAAAPADAEGSEGSEDAEGHKEEPEDKKEVKLGQDDEDAVKGKQLIQALRNPQSAALIIEHLAKQAGYTKGELKEAIKKEPEALKDDILDILKEELGDEFEFLNTRLAKALGKVLDIKLEKSQADIRSSMMADKLAKLNNEADAAIKQLADKYYDKDVLPKDVHDLMSKLQGKLSPGKDQTVKDYLEDLFYAAAGRLGLTLTTKQQRGKIKRNNTDVPSRLTSSGSPIPDGNGRQSTTRMSLEESVESAFESVSKN